MISRFQFGGAGDDRAFWVLLCLLLLAVLLPTGCLLYFINEAVNGQRNLARQELGEAYQGQLRLISTQLDSFWEQRARELDNAASESPGTFFEHCVRDGLADSVICLDRDGWPAYPSLAAVPLPDPLSNQPDWLAARSLEDSGQFAGAAQKYAGIAASAKETATMDRASQSRIRCLVRSGQTSLAIREIDERFYNFHGAWGANPDGHMIAADEQLYYLQLLPPRNRQYEAHAKRLQGLLQNYTLTIPSSQRLFLMGNMRALPLHLLLPLFPTYGAERMAERVLSEGQAVPPPGDVALRLSGIADIWRMPSHDNRVVALYKTATVVAAMRRFQQSRNAPQGPMFYLTPPGRAIPPHNQSIAAGSRLPGWQLSMEAPSIPTSGTGARRQIAAYLWIGFLTIAMAAVLATLGAQALRRQMRIAHLKTDLVAAVSHELKTPLASMKLLVESLLSGEQFEPKRTRQYLEMVARENSRLSRLIDNFLTFSRMERNRGSFDFARVQPAAIARAAIDSIGDRFSIIVTIADSLPPLYADFDALVTVVLNLLENAYKYTTENRRIELRVAYSDGRVSFIVKDNGIGLTEKEQKKIFRRFYQVDRRLTRQTGGVGLGLSIVEFIVKAHDGVVSVVSQPGAGSTFTVSLPPSSSAAGAAA